MASLFFSQHNGVFPPSTLLIVIFWVIFGFPHCPWVWPLTRIAAYIPTILLRNQIFAIYPPSEACLWTRPLQWRKRCWWRLILQWHRTSIPSCYCWRPTRQSSSRIIIRRCRVDSDRRWEHLAGFGKVSKVVSCCIILGTLSIKAYMWCLPYLSNRVPLLRPMRDRGAVTMSLWSYFF